jgi:cation diffusion facilitator CzcD-associated flavoprotein CzcO
VFSFEPNPDWSGFYAYSDEIQQYFLHFADKYGLRKYVQVNTEVVSATWDEEEGKCKSQPKLPHFALGWSIQYTDKISES